MDSFLFDKFSIDNHRDHRVSIIFSEETKKQNLLSDFIKSLLSNLVKKSVQKSEDNQQLMKEYLALSTVFNNQIRMFRLYKEDIERCKGFMRKQTPIHEINYDDCPVSLKEDDRDG